MTTEVRNDGSERPGAEPVAEGTKMTGVLDRLSGGAGILRRPENSYLPGDDDVYVPARLIDQYGLRQGDNIEGEVGSPPGKGKLSPLRSILAVNGDDPETARGRPRFDKLRASHPDERLTLELTGDDAQDNGAVVTTRILDLVVPLGKGQRALIVAPSKAGKTMLLQAVMRGIATNYPDAELIVLLVDERPEEVTEMQRMVESLGRGETLSSSFDFPPDRHVQVAEMALERARRLVESGKDVVLVLDSITRLARAHNSIERSSGRTLSGGIEAGALEAPKRFFGSARKVVSDLGGSLTIIATALVDTGSRADEVIFEEFKGTGNAEIVLARELADQRIWPAIDVTSSGTRKEELLYAEEHLERLRLLRRFLSDMRTTDAAEFLINKVKQTKSNEDLLASMSR
ncbi:MAG TPA: transcription termination factor Rho [Gemmatimonadota bacterium]|nr:transcription termination factor Rho [Gemmatimonadota bacterium]